MARVEPAYRYGVQALEKEGVPWLLRMTMAAFWRPSVPWALASGVMFALAVMSLNRISAFLYYQF